MITNRQADVLLHASRNGRYVTDEADVIQMGRDGLLFDHGPQALAGGMHYLVMTPKSREALSEWKRAQPAPPKPPKPKRIGKAFAAWRQYREATFDRIGFPEFNKEIWPNYQFR